MPRARFLTHNDRAYRRQKVVDAYNRGAPVRDLAERYGLSRWYVREVLRNAGVSRGRWPNRQPNQFTPEGEAGLA
jgi:Mor family transcriptional regulator